MKTSYFAILIFIVTIYGYFGIAKKKDLSYSQLKYDNELIDRDKINFVKMYEVIKGEEIISERIIIQPPRTSDIYDNRSHFKIEPYYGRDFSIIIDINLESETFATLVRNCIRSYKWNNTLSIVQQELTINRKILYNKNKLIGKFYCKVEKRRNYYKEPEYIVFKGIFEKEMYFKNDDSI